MKKKIKHRHPEKVKNPINPIKKKPDWIRSKIVDSQVFPSTPPNSKLDTNSGIISCPINSF